MRNNGPVTQRDIPFGDDEEIVSATDTRGIITYCNDTFCRIAHFDRSELIGQPHNMLRHSDMPPAAYQMLWDRLQSGKAWMGIVKNRAKNGDHYWVDAYIVPLKDGGTTTGYESVRVKPQKIWVERAEATYKRIMSGQAAIPRSARIKPMLTNVLLPGLLAFILVFLAELITAGFSLKALVLSVLAATIAGFGVNALLKIGFSSSLNNARQIVNDPLAAWIYTGRTDAIGEIHLAQIFLKARLRTALGRFRESAHELQGKADMAQEQARCSHNGMTAQQEETTKVAQSMQQMSQAVQDVAAGAARTSEATGDALQQVGHGNKVLEHASGAIRGLSENVGHLGSVVSRLSEDSAQIASVIDVIRGIAEQTNLLALNAAIEAARAGEQGRGFAVVADEVRTLAQRTQESTQHIQQIIEKLGNATADAANNMSSCQQLSEKSVEEMGNVKEALGSISAAVNTIDAMSQQIASAAEEQSVSAVEIERNTLAISDISARTQQEAQSAAELSHQMAELSNKQFSLVRQFN